MAVTATGGAFQNNTATTFSGGGLATGSSSGTLTFRDTRFVANKAGNGGGGAAVSAGVIGTGGLFQGNSGGAGTGGGLSAGSVALTGTRFISNTVSQDGGGLSMGGPGSPASLLDVVFEANQAARGGGVFARRLALMSNSIFKANTATSMGGGGYFFAGATPTATQFLSNTAVSRAGGVYVEGPLNANASVFINNAATVDRGGAVLCATACSGRIVTSLFSRSTGGGPGVIITAGGMTIRKTAPLAAHRSSWAPQFWRTVGRGQPSPTPSWPATPMGCAHRQASSTRTTTSFPAIPSRLSVAAGAHSLSGAASFVDPSAAANDFSLRSSSAAIDRGNCPGAAPLTDLRGALRRQGTGLRYRSL